LIDLSTIPDETLIDLVHSLLSNGVTPTTIAHVLGIDADLLRDVQSEIRVRQFGTDELDEAMDFLMWRAYEQANNILRSGTTQEKIRAISMVLSKAVGLAGRRPPETFGNIREELAKLAAASLADGGAEDEPSEFLVSQL
jgi:hypothetical protein